MPTRFLETPDKIKYCPYCKSIFINEKECESCGRQLHFDPLGGPFGERSFYQMKLTNNKRHDQKRLLHRYKILLDYLFSEKRAASDIFMLELNDLIKCMNRIGVSAVELFRPLTEKSSDPLYWQVEEMIWSSRQKKPPLFSLRVWGLRPAVLIIWLATLALIIGLAYFYFSYRLKR